MLNPKTFVDEIERRISSSQDNLSWFIDAYLWAQRNLTKIHKHYPEYTNEWLRREVRRLHSVDPQVYVRTARRLGGGSGKKEFEYGRRLVRRFGVYECFRAVRVLTPDQMAEIGRRCEQWDIDQFSEEVKRIDVMNRGDAVPKRGGSLGLREKIEELRQENEELKTENSILRAKLEVLDDLKLLLNRR
jgi:hypothetical protein